MKWYGLLVAFICFTKMDSVFAGRYEFHQNQQYPAQSLLLDTQTGKMWKMTCYSEMKDGDCSVKAWAPVDIVGINITEADVWKAVEANKKSK